MTRYAVTLWLTVKGPAHAENFDAVVARYATVEAADERLLDCAWSLTDNGTYGDVEVEATVAAADGTAAVGALVAAVREAIHGTGARTLAWDVAGSDVVVYRLANEAVTTLDAA